MAPLKILISGAGIAGTALAFWLSRLGHDVTVIERFPHLRTTGLQIDLRGHGIEILKRMGLEKTFRDKSVKEEGLLIVDKSGKQRAYFPANLTGEGPQGFTSEFEIMRGDLCRLLHDAAGDSVDYVFGTSIDSFEDKDDSVEVRFADGRLARYDLVVGADGVMSRTRRMMLGPKSPDGFHRLKDTYAAYFSTHRPIQEGEKHVATWHIAPGGRMWMTRRHKPDELQVYLGGKTDSERLKNARPGDVEEEKAALVEFYEKAGRQADEALGYLRKASDFYCERLGLVKLDHWSRGRVALVGDAAYCPTASSGMGTTSALMGAYILAGEIGRHCGSPSTESGARESGAGGNIVDALKAYEQKFKPFMDQIQAGVENSSSWDRFSSPLGIAMLTWFLSVLAFLRIDIFVYMRKEDVKGWELPAYEVLVQKS